MIDRNRKTSDLSDDKVDVAKNGNLEKLMIIIFCLPVIAVAAIAVHIAYHMIFS